MQDLNTNTLNNTEPKKRGRKMGYTTGPRPTIFIACAVINDEIIMEKFSSPAGPDVSKEEVLAYDTNCVIADFMAEHGVEPASIMGPLYDVKGVEVKTVRKRDTLNISNQELKLGLTGEIGSWKEWKGIVHEIVDRPDARYFIPTGELVPSSDSKKKTLPKAISVPVASINLIKSKEINTINV